MQRSAVQEMLCQHGVFAISVIPRLHPGVPPLFKYSRAVQCGRRPGEERPSGAEVTVRVGVEAPGPDAQRTSAPVCSCYHPPTGRCLSQEQALLLFFSFYLSASSFDKKCRLLMKHFASRQFSYLSVGSSHRSPSTFLPTRQWVSSLGASPGQKIRSLQFTG